MAEKRRLGINWGDHSFCFAEVEKGKLLKSSCVPFSTPINAYQSQDVPEGLRFTTLIQKALQDLNITTKKINLSLPAKDIIFRSFIIPWMEPEEVKNVVDFEAIKYIPIKLDELSYTYQAIPVNENNQKNIRIIFVGTRKDTLTKYMGILEHTGLTVEWAEPSPMSLARALEQRGHLTRGHGSAVVQIDAQGGKIIFIDHEVVQFVREFQLQGWDASTPAGFEDFTSRLFNEIRVSLNFYSRQNPQGKITKIVVLALQDIPKLTASLTESINIPATLLTASAILKTSSANEIGLLNAFGIGLRDKKSAFNNFNLSQKSAQPLGSTGFNLEETKYRVAAGIVILAVAMVGIVFSLSKKSNAVYKEKLSQLQMQQGPFETSSVDDIKKLEQDLNIKIRSYKDVQMKSKMAFYLNRLPKLLPPGTWLRTWELSYTDRQISGEDNSSSRTVSKIAISIEGYAYVENTNEQFRLVNSLVTTLKGTKDIAGAFGSIDLVSVRQESINNYPVTYFKIDFR